VGYTFLRVFRFSFPGHNLTIARYTIIVTQHRSNVTDSEQSVGRILVFWPVELSSGRLEASRRYSENDSGWMDTTTKSRSVRQLN
jgi:hypothetical protein